MTCRSARSRLRLPALLGLVLGAWALHASGATRANANVATRAVVPVMVPVMVPVEAPVDARLNAGVDVPVYVPVKASADVGTTTDIDTAALGARLYLQGRGADGRAVRAYVQGDVPVPPAAAACVQCHRRSGLGVAEGGVRSAAIDTHHLFAPVAGPMGRPAYDEATLLRAVTAGLDAAGRPLNPLMPRYALTPTEVGALAAYLRQLGLGRSPGVTDDSITIATIIADTAPQAEREATQRVLERFVANKNAGTRHEAQRAAAARRHPFGEKADRHWRRWKMQVWRLHGAPSTWPDQLAAYQQHEPAFAVVGGTAGRDWGTVHRFCEAERLPCILPLTSSLPDLNAAYYALYFNAGVSLEAAITAKAITRSAELGPRTRVLVVHDDSTAGRAAWKALQAQWHAAGRDLPQERVIADSRPLDAAGWQQLLASSRPEVLVAWVDPPQLQGLLATAVAPFLPARIYTAETFTDLRSVHAATALQGRLRHVYPWRLPRDTAHPFPREEAWLRGQGLADLDPRLAGRVLFAGHVFGEAAGNLRGNFSQDYLMEDLEHMLDGSDMTTLLPRTSLGPGQRVLSRGAYVFSPATVDAGAAAPWLE